MRNSQHCSPVIIDGETCHVLERIGFTERAYSEEWLQGLLFERPSLIPVNEIEPLFSPLIPLARELKTNVGPVDVVYINPAGYLTIVETKLWRNPEARRQVVAQIMDYAAAISRWSYEDLRDAVKSAGGPADLVESAAELEENFDRARFIDAVSKNLARGRMLLLLVGDGIQEGVEQLTDTLSRSPQLGFSLGLLELATYRFGEESKTLVLPRVIARTREVVRAVVEVRMLDGKPQVDVSVPEATPGKPPDVRHRPTVEVILEQIRSAVGPETGRFEKFLARAEELGVGPEGRDASLSLFWYEPNTERRFTFGSIYTDGHVDFHFVMGYYRKAGIDNQIGYDYIRAVAALLPGAVVKERKSRELDWWADITISGKPVRLTKLLARADEWLLLIEQFMKRTQEAAEAVGK
jgi:hypothetical protein